MIRPYPYSEKWPYSLYDCSKYSYFFLKPFLYIIYSDKLQENISF